MLELKIKNINEIEEEYREEVKAICNEKAEYYKELLKRYDKDLVLEIIFDHSSETYKVSASVNFKRKKILVAEEDKEVIKAVNAMFSELKKLVKKQYEIEKGK